MLGLNICCCSQSDLDRIRERRGTYDYCSRCFFHPFKIERKAAKSRVCFPLTFVSAQQDSVTESESEAEGTAAMACLTTGNNIQNDAAASVTEDETEDEFENLQVCDRVMFPVINSVIFLTDSRDRMRSRC